MSTRIRLDEAPGAPHWMPIYFSLMLVLLTLFVFLFSYTEKDPAKVRVFRENFKKSLMLIGTGRGGAEAAHDNPYGGDPLAALVNRMKYEGLNAALTDEFLTLAQIKGLRVRDGQRGAVVVVPQEIAFGPGGSELNTDSRNALTRISFLAAELPYLVEVAGYAGPDAGGDPLEASARAARRVYEFLLQKGVDPRKLKVAGYGRGGAGDKSRARIEIAFKEPEL